MDTKRHSSELKNLLESTFALAVPTFYPMEIWRFSCHCAIVVYNMLPGNLQVCSLEKKSFKEVFALYLSGISLSVMYFICTKFWFLINKCQLQWKVLVSRALLANLKINGWTWSKFCKHNWLFSVLLYFTLLKHSLLFCVNYGLHNCVIYRLTPLTMHVLLKLVMRKVN